jgi:hypothetical protein
MGGRTRLVRADVAAHLAAAARQPRARVEPDMNVNANSEAVQEKAARSLGLEFTDESKATVRRLRRVMIEKHNALFAKLLSNPIRTEASFLHGLVVGSDAHVIALRARRRALAVRRFEIDDMTRGVLQCPCCTDTSITAGLFMDNSGGQNKFVFKRRTSETACGFKYVYRYHTESWSTDEKVDNVCKSCVEQLTARQGGEDHQPSFSEPAGFSHGVDVPECLKNLTYAEEALVALIQPACAVRKLKRGMSTVKGHVSFFDRSSNIKEVATTMPRLVADIEVVELRRAAGAGPTSSGWREFHCDRRKVESALTWLIHNSPAYADVSISMANLAALPIGGQIEVRVVEVDEEDEEDARTGQNVDDEDLGPAPAQQAPVGDDGQFEATHSGTVVGGNVRAAEDAQRAAADLQQVHQRTGPRAARVAAPEPNSVFLQPRASFVDWKAEKYFFAKAFPTLFMPGSLNPAPLPASLAALAAAAAARSPVTSDIPAEFKCVGIRDRPLDFVLWGRHLMHAADGRYTAHPTFTFACLNIKQRAQSASCTQFGIKQLPGEQPHDLQALRAMLETDGPNAAAKLARNMTAYTKNITDSPAYWWQRRSEVGAHVHKKLFLDDELPFAFHTGSMAEYHMPGLYLVLEMVMLRWGRVEEARLCHHIATAAQGAAPTSSTTSIHKILLQFPSIQNEFFVLRTEAWFKIVLKEGLGIDDYWYRFEFAKSRGTIHFHALIFSNFHSKALHSTLNNCAQAAGLEELEVLEAGAAQDLFDALPAHFVPLSAEHPAGRVRDFPGVPPTGLAKSWAEDRVDPETKGKFVIGEDVPPDMIGNTDQWPPHEGNLTEPDAAASCLRTRLYEVSEGALLKSHLINFANRVCLHCCSSYCLRKTKQGTGEDRYETCSCRMHFGEENTHPMIKARTDGKSVRSVPGFTHKGGVTYLECPRDHRRLQQGNIELAAAWGANADIQSVVACGRDLPDVPAGVDILSFIASDEAERAAALAAAQDDSAELKKLKEELRAKADMWKERRYLNKDEYCERLIDYVVAYACKGEVSSTEAAEMFKQIIKSGLDESTPLASLLRKLNNKIVTAKEMPRAEAVFALSGLPLYSSSMQCANVTLAVGSRQVADGTRDGDDRQQTGAAAAAAGGGGSRAVRDNAFDKFLKGKESGDIGAAVTYYENVASSKTPVFSHGHVRATWPLSEEYAYTTLLLHKRGVMKHDDIKGSHDSHVEALRDFLQGPNVPQGIVNAIHRAYRASIYDTRDQKRGAGNRRVAPTTDARGGGADGTPPDTPPDAAFPPLDDNDQDDGVDIGDFDMEDELQHQAMAAYNMGVEHNYPENAATFVSERVAAFTAAAETAPFSLRMDTRHGKTHLVLDPIGVMDNEGQRFLLCLALASMQQWHEHLTNPAHPPAPPPIPDRVSVAGVAGTGKSYTLMILRNIADIFVGTNRGSVALGPSGASAGGIGGSTADRALSFSRTKKDPTVLDPGKLLNLQRAFAPLFLLNADESSMWGQLLLGNYVSRLDACLSRGAHASEDEVDVPAFGGVPLHIFWGDQKQLPPVLDKPGYSASGASKMENLGHRAYSATTTHALLDQPMRQDPTTPFMQRLTALRDGPVTATDLAFWSGRRVAHFSAEEKALYGLYNPHVLYATCKNKDRDEINQRYVKHFEDVVVVKATCTGSHATAMNSPKAGLLGKIPRTAYYARGMMVKLLTNLLPEEGLYNNARGTIVDVIYPEGGGYNPDDKTQLPILIVDFPSYSGPAWLPGALPADIARQTWVPISAVSLRCDSSCCSRRGLPVVCSKADSIHSLQGLTIGDEHAIKRLLITWDPKDEGLWPGIFYVGASRAEAEHNVAIAFDVTKQGMSKVCTNEGWHKQNDEVLRLVGRARAERKARFENPAGFRDGDPEKHWGSKFDFAMRLDWFITAMSAKIALPGTPPATRASISVALAQWRASLSASGVLQAMADDSG